MSKKKYIKDKVDWKAVFNLKNFLHILIGIAMATFAIKVFMEPNNFVDGGVTGLSILLGNLFHIPISIPFAVLNIIFIYLGYKKISKTFAVQTIIAVAMLSVCLIFVHIDHDKKPIVEDPTLVAIFGGLLIGTGTGLVIRGGGIVDGADVIAVFTQRKVPFSNTEILLFFNSIIIIVDGIYFSLPAALYSIITYFAATRATDYVVDGIEEFAAVNIISAAHEEVKSFLVNELGKGITVFKGERGYLPGSFDIRSDCEIIVTIVTRLEIKRIQETLEEIDPKVFIYIQSVKEAAGGVLKHKAHVK